MCRDCRLILLPAHGEKVAGRPDEGLRRQPTISSVHFWFSQSDFVWYMS